MYNVVFAAITSKLLILLDFMLDFKRFNPFVMVISSFVFVALFGALVLMQPWATQSGVSTRFIDAFFISSSAIFVTGLTMFETASYWSHI